MKIALIAVPILDWVDGELRPVEMDAYRVCPPYGIYLLASVARDRGHEVAIVDLIAAQSIDLDPYAKVLANADLVGVAATSLCWPSARRVIAAVRELRPDVKIVVGNIHASLFDSYLLESAPIDFCIRGEAEVALIELAAALESKRPLDSVPNLTYRDGGRIVRNAAGPRLSESAIGGPLPAYEELPSGAYQHLAIESSRGCALDCSFCSTGYRRSWIGLDVERFVDRLDHVRGHLGRVTGGAVHVIDDELAMNPKRAAQIGRALSDRPGPYRLIYDARAIDFLKAGFAEAIAPHTEQLLIGAECGYDEGLLKIGKGITVDTLERCAAELARLGYADRADFSFILGLPWEGIEEVRKTIAFGAHLFGTYGVRLRFNWFLLMPGSRLWEEARRAGRVSAAMYDEPGAYHGLYLFREGVRLTPEQLYEVRDTVVRLTKLGRLLRRDTAPIAFFFPRCIEEAFPPSTSNDTSLAQLRHLARPDRVPLTIID
jgi:anaerobic magnesium-protoporphyrin IX monomethyl ester cyclase